MNEGKRNRSVPENLTAPDLFRRWMDLCHRLGLDGGNEWETFDRHYVQSQRGYHNLSHIADCLRQLDAYPGEIQDPVALEIAIWFHDLIYDPRASDNEVRSADEAERFLGGSALGSKVRELILATCHRGTIPCGDEELIADIDLSILGSEPSVYRKYAAAIRSEYAFVAEPDYVTGRYKVLSAFLKRPRIFSTAHFRATLESIALRNLESELRSLASPK